LIFDFLEKKMLSILARRGASSLLARSTTTPMRSFHSEGELFNPTEEHAQLREMIREFSASEIDAQAAEFDAKGTLNVSLFRRVADLGLLGLTVPEKDGGAGMDATAATIVHHEMSKFDPGFTLAYLAHSMLFVNNFYYCSNEDQRARYLPQVLSGEWVAGMGMTEPGAGTDVLGMSTSAKRVGDEYLLNGSKTYITNTVEAHCFLVYAKVDGRVTAFIVDRAMDGFSTSNKIDKIGMRGSTMGELFFQDCRVPLANRIGEEGQGVLHMMRNLEIERLTLAGMSVGIAERCVQIMIDYGASRTAFGSSINKFGQVQRYIGESFAELQAAKCLTYNEARRVAPGSQNRVGTDAAKLFAAPVGKRAADNAMQVLGGAGYCREHPVERLWRDAKLLEIGGGTLESHQKNLTKDLTRAHC
jgi:isovaleryl-CoA dehydrogenase